jgi:hypothetical protein
MIPSGVFTPRQTIKDQSRPMRAFALRSLLIEKARRKEVTFYQEWMDFFNIDRFEIAKVLDAVIDLDSKMGTPFVASLVVKKNAAETAFHKKTGGLSQAEMQQKCFEFYASI